ncbi:hypothetical protein K4L44_13695 [Halosquirtibacter laminarini]|uniref:Uncharacterized protein n=1 Tax=Halosquirtibacter laminarini TaxID=3374600 RepID=A0AC61NDH2_9BACT|nr:hypothetical protein K4L44_13695 [Prolixibacteraceae bacterium]
MSNKKQLECIIVDKCNTSLDGKYLPLATQMADTLQIREDEILSDKDFEMIASGVVYAASIHLSLTEGLMIDDEEIAMAFGISIPQMEEMANHLFQLESLLGASDAEMDRMETEVDLPKETKVEDPEILSSGPLTINRFAVTLTPKQLFVDFLNRMEVSETPLHMEHFRNQSSVYLIDDKEDVHLGAPELFLAPHAENMVQMELTKEFVDSKYWPTGIDMDHLLSWFDYSISIMVTDLHAPNALIHDIEE